VKNIRRIKIMYRIILGHPISYAILTELGDEEDEIIEEVTSYGDTIMYSQDLQQTSDLLGVEIKIAEKE
jgi:hypothetical protein